MYCVATGDDVTVRVGEEVRQEVKGEDRKGGRSRMQGPIFLWTPPCLKVAPLRLEARTLQGPGRKQTEESQEAAQLRSVTGLVPCHSNNCWGQEALQSGWVPCKTTTGIVSEALNLTTLLHPSLPSTWSLQGGCLSSQSPEHLPGSGSFYTGCFLTSHWIHFYSL